jgi:predicted PhzF superfamily epimerase YddE/YHI9
VGRDGRVSVWVDKRGEEHHVRVGGTGCFVRELEIELPRD